MSENTSTLFAIIFICAALSGMTFFISDCSKHSDELDSYNENTITYNKHLMIRECRASCEPYRVVKMSFNENNSIICECGEGLIPHRQTVEIAAPDARGAMPTNSRTVVAPDAGIPTRPGNSNPTPPSSRFELTN